MNDEIIKKYKDIIKIVNLLENASEEKVKIVKYVTNGIVLAQ